MWPQAHCLSRGALRPKATCIGLVRVPGIEPGTTSVSGRSGLQTVDSLYFMRRALATHFLLAGLFSTRSHSRSTHTQPGVPAQSCQAVQPGVFVLFQFGRWSTWCRRNQARIIAADRCPLGA